MIILYLKEFLQSKGIDQPYAWLRKQKISHHAADRLLNGRVKSISFKHIEAICTAAYCTPNDLFTWTPEGVYKEMKDHPLQAIAARPFINITPQLKMLTKNEMAEMQGKLMELLQKRTEPETPITQS